MITVELKNLKFTVGSLKISSEDNDFSLELNDFSYEVEASKEEIEVAEISSLVSKVISEVNGNDLSEKVDKILHKVYATDAESDSIHRRITENTTDLKHIKSVVDDIQASSWMK